MIRKAIDWPRSLLSVMLLAVSVDAAAGCEIAVGHVAAVQGRVEVRGIDAASWTPVEVEQRLCAGDRISVYALGRAAVVLDNDVLVRLDQNTTLTIMPPARQADSGLGLAEGALHVISRFRKRFGVQTPFVNALVDGTEFTVLQDRQRGRVVVAEGRVRARGEGGEIVLLAGESAEAGPSGAPSPIRIRPVDAIRWAIHYPPVVRLPDTVVSGLPGAVAQRVREAVAVFAAHRPATALELLGEDGAVRAVPELRALRASMLLSVGRVDEARHLVGDLPAGAGSASLQALDAIIKLAANDVPAAMDRAAAAVAADRHSAAAWLALSYARQAERDPEGALEAAAAACLAAPDDALAWARRAEMALALSRIDEGRRHAEHAVMLDPAVARGGALLGFAHLLAGDRDLALARFEAAIQADSNEPLAHQGLGLALIGEGALAAGRRALEVAVILDPSNAELRSTLGRAYLEEARGKVASDQFELAKRLDPASPTPWYYGAFGKLRANDPIGAIVDGQRAIELNDNRAVLRSDSLLDSDRAARNADLGPAYQQLGFEASLAEAARGSLADDPSSSAAHRLTADAYGEQNGFESARLSELLQARLRAPLGGRPLDAYQLVPALPVLDGPRALSPEETSALFATGAHHFSAGVLAGSQDTRGLSVTASSASEKAQVSASAYDLRSDGFGDAANVAISGQKLDVQLAASASTAILAELSHSDRSGSNFAQRLFADAGDPDRSSLIRRDEGRLSLRHAPSTDEEWIVSANVAKVDAGKVATSTFPGGLVISTDDTRDVDLHELAIHYSKVAGIASWQAGANAYRADDRGQSAFACCSAGDALVPDPPTRRTVDHDHVYASVGLGLSRALSGMLGIDYDHYRDTDISPVERFSGKLGIAYRPTAGSEVRAALIQTVKGDYWREAGIEPTVFNGFEQIFDDTNGSTSTRIAVAAQHRFARGALIGAEWSVRRVSIPKLGCTGPCRADWRELRHRIFAEMPLASWAAVSAQWRFESSRRDDPPEPGTAITVPIRLHTELIPLGLWVRPMDDLGVLLEAVRIRQKGTAYSDGIADTRRESVWLANLRIRYQTSYAPWYLEAGVRNLFDQQFSYQNTDYRDEARTPFFYPDRTVYMRMGFSF